MINWGLVLLITTLGVLGGVFLVPLFWGPVTVAIARAEGREDSWYGEFSTDLLICQWILLFILLWLFLVCVFDPVEGDLTKPQLFGLVPAGILAFISMQALFRSLLWIARPAARVANWHSFRLAYLGPKRILIRRKA